MQRELIKNLLTVIEELLPGIGRLVVDIKLLNETLIAADKYLYQKEIFTQSYGGWESLQDWDRDMHEAITEINPYAKLIPNEFTGTIHVSITYEDKTVTE